ncbi:MAG: tetratricopeptide repeat protein [Goleter apudmare HA4340-LM2]|jgi:hypothetical protein|nr:tetratricopeptide repeat protein [Goleter apudmare HA4340-LM2]
MTSTVQIPAELCQIVLLEKINHAVTDGLQLMYTKQYDQALAIFYQVLERAASLSNLELRESAIASIIWDQHFTFLPLTQLPRQKQNQWLEWLGTVQRYVLNLGTNASLAIANHLKQVIEGYKVFKRNDLAVIALKQATQAARQISEPVNRANELTQLVANWWRFQYKAESLLNEALVAVEQIPNEDPYSQWSYLFSIASLYVQLGEPRRAIALMNKIDNEYYQNSIRQEIVRNAIKRGDLQFAQTITDQILGAEYQANALVEIAVYWVKRYQRQRSNRLFAQALQRVAKDERAQSLQSTLIQTYVTSGQITISLNAAQRLTQDEPKALALGAIALAYAKAKQPQQVQQVLVQLQGLIQSEAAINSVGYVGNILQAAVDAQQFDLAMAIVNAVENNLDFVSKQSWYQQIVQAPLQSQNLDKALQLAKQIPNDIWQDERNACLQEIAIAYANAKQWRQAMELLTQINNTNNTPYQVLTRTELAVIAPTLKEFTALMQPAIAQAQALELREHKALALSAIAQAYLRSGDEQSAQCFLQQAIQTVKQEGYVDEQGTLMASLNDYLIQQGQYTVALAIAKANPVSSWQLYSYGNIFQRAVKSWAFDVALEIIELDSVPDKQAAQLLELAKTYAQLQRHEDAITLLNRAFAVAQQIADPESRMIQITDDFQIPDESDRTHQYTRLVKQYVSLGQLELAQKVVEQVQATELRDYLQAWIHC